MTLLPMISYVDKFASSASDYVSLH